MNILSSLYVDKAESLINLPEVTQLVKGRARDLKLCLSLSEAHSPWKGESEIQGYLGFSG